MTVSVSLPGKPDHHPLESSVNDNLATTHLQDGDAEVHDDGDDDDGDATIPHHPLGVKPSGNALTADWSLRPAIGTLAILPDEMIMPLLLYLEAPDLLRLGRTCKALYAFTRAEELWKTLFILSPVPTFKWRGTWRASYLNLPPSAIPAIDCSQLFSDTLHRPFYCAHVPLTDYANNIPARNQITRMPDLSVEEFQESWSDRPFILTEPVKDWPAYKDWSMEYLAEKYGDTVFRAEVVDWTMQTYVEYVNNNSDESPLYLFDRDYVKKMNLTVDDEEPKPGDTPPAYTNPPCFGEDYFSVLGRDRPDNRWLVIGPSRSGSTFHKDPNATSAWNAVLRGSKYWITFPSTASGLSATSSNREPLPAPPGVYVSPDHGEVTTPLSIAEWILSFHAEARRTPGCIEAICHAGELLYVPSGWWHLVVNLEPNTPTIAITQNFISHSHITPALDFLKNKPDQVTGFRCKVENGAEGQGEGGWALDPYQTFVERMEEKYPELLKEKMEEMEKREAGEKKKRKWDEVVHGPTGEDEGEGGGFSFGFGDDGSDVEVP